MQTVYVRCFVTRLWSQTLLLISTTMLLSMHQETYCLKMNDAQWVLSSLKRDWKRLSFHEAARRSSKTIESKSAFICVLVAIATLEATPVPIKMDVSLMQLFAIILIVSETATNVCASFAKCTLALVASTRETAPLASLWEEMDARFFNVIMKTVCKQAPSFKSISALYVGQSSVILALSIRRC